MIVINFKTYEQATAEKAIELAKICQEVSEQTQTKIIIAVQATDIKQIASAVSIPVFAQHIDPISYGSNTGHILPESVKAAGASGTLINHAEHRLPLETIKATIERAKQIGLTTFVCAAKPEIAASIAGLQPDYIAIEPPELIGGDTSVSTAQPEIITDTIEKVHAVNPISVLCGAGVKTRKDVEVAIQLGSKGILVASGIVKASDPKQALEQLAAGMKNGL